MAGVQFADVRFHPTEFLDLTSLTVEEFQSLVVGVGQTAISGYHGRVGTAGFRSRISVGSLSCAEDQPASADHTRWG